MKKNYWGSKKQPYFHIGANPTVDVVVIFKEKVLLISRGKEPGKGKWAIPGGFQDTYALKGKAWKEGKETSKDAALRELEEETGISKEIAKKYIKPLAIFDRFGRDPRDNKVAWSVSQVFLIEFPSHLDIKIKAGDDAKKAAWFTKGEASEINFLFDHQDMLFEAGFFD